MFFFNVVGVVFGRDGVGFLLASALAGAKAEVEQMKKSIHGLLRCDPLVRPLRAHGANEGKRKSN